MGKKTEQLPAQEKHKNGAQIPKKIAFCYFDSKNVHYVPLDIGYSTALIEQAHPGQYAIEIVPLTLAYEDDEKQQQDDVQHDCNAIVKHEPDAVFLFAESILWSKVFALGRAKKIAQELRLRKKSLFIGIQSYKIQPQQTAFVLGEGFVDCVITGDPETVLMHLSAILEKKELVGVSVAGRQIQRDSTVARKDASVDGEAGLDSLPSPYLQHVFDAYIRKKQEEWGNNFRAFLISSRGCGFGCYYCFRSVKFEKVRFFSAQRFFDEMEYLLNNFGVYKFFVLDDAFLYSRKRLHDFVGEFNARKKGNRGLERVKLFLMARPESIDEEVAALLSELQVVLVQIGLQTVKEELQHYMNRKVPVAHFQNIAAWFAKHRISLCLDVIFGLPDDSIDSFKKTIAYARSLRPLFIHVKQFYLNPNTRFFVEKNKYEIGIEARERDFDAPFVVKARGLSEAYFKEASDFMQEQIKNHPEICWKFLAEKSSYVGPNMK